MRESLPGLIFLLIISLFLAPVTFAQNPISPKIYLAEDSSRYLKFSGGIQIWSRYAELNPGSEVNEVSKSSVFDFSIRRLRFKVSGKTGKKLFFDLQIGGNNFNYLSNRPYRVGILDASAEYKFSSAFTLGGGKSAWRGLSRYSVPSTGKALAYDIPFVAYTTITASDDILRSTGVYAKGQVNRLDYRWSLVKPLSPHQWGGFKNTIIENKATITDRKLSYRTSTYLKWMFLDREGNRTPFSVGTYYRPKRILNLGVGAEIQPHFTWHQEGSDTVYNDMINVAIDVFYVNNPDNNKGNGLTAYAAAYFYRYGPNFVRNLGVNNPVNGIDVNEATFNGRGNAYPLSGTGTHFYLQAAYLFGYFNEDHTCGRLQPYANLQYSFMEGLDEKMVAFDLGLNWVLNGHLSKFSLNLQNRPVFDDVKGKTVEITRKNIVVLQYNFRFE